MKTSILANENQILTKGGKTLDKVLDKILDDGSKGVETIVLNIYQQSSSTSFKFLDTSITYTKFYEMCKGKQVLLHRFYKNGDELLDNFPILYPITKYNQSSVTFGDGSVDYW